MRNSQQAWRPAALAYALLVFVGLTGGLLPVIVSSCAKALSLENSVVMSTFSIFSLGSVVMVQSTPHLLSRRPFKQVIASLGLLFVTSCTAFFWPTIVASWVWPSSFTGWASA